MATAIAKRVLCIKLSSMVTDKIPYIKKSTDGVYAFAFLSNLLFKFSTSRWRITAYLLVYQLVLLCLRLHVYKSL